MASSLAPRHTDILADGDLEWVSIFIDHFAVVALDRADLEEAPVAGLTLRAASSLALPKIS